MERGVIGLLVRGVFFRLCGGYFLEVIRKFLIYGRVCGRSKVKGEIGMFVVGVRFYFEFGE